MQIFIYAIFLITFFTPILRLNASFTPEQEEISQVIQQFVENWNQHNPEKMADLWHEDGDLIRADGTWVKGREHVAQLFLQEQIEHMKDSTLHLTVQDVRLFAPNVAWVDAEGTIFNITDPAGLCRSFDHHVIFMIVKQNTRWGITAVRPYQFFVPQNKLCIDGVKLN